MLKNKDMLREYLTHDICNYGSQNFSWLNKFRSNLFSTPISDQKYIWKYIKTLRFVEYYEKLRKSNIVYTVLYLYYLHKLRKYSRITGFQIPPSTCGKGLTIWHWGPIIINPAAKIGENCTLYPGVLIGHKYPGGGAATIGDNVFIGAGTKIIGPVKIGDNVTIGQNCVITKDIPGNSVIVNENILRYL